MTATGPQQRDDGHRPSKHGSRFCGREGLHPASGRVIWPPAVWIQTRCRLLQMRCWPVEAVVARLPVLGLPCCTRSWRACCKRVYGVLSCVAVLWVMWQQQGRVYFGCSLCTAALRHRAVLSACSSCWDWMQGCSRWKVRLSCAPWSRWLPSFRRKSLLLTTCTRCENILRSTGPCLSRLQTPLATCWLNVSGLRELKAFSMPQSWQSWIPQSRLQLRRKRSQQVQSQRPQAIAATGFPQPCGRRSLQPQAFHAATRHVQGQRQQAPPFPPPSAAPARALALVVALTLPGLPIR